MIGRGGRDGIAEGRIGKRRKRSVPLTFISWLRLCMVVGLNCVNECASILAVFYRQPSARSTEFVAYRLWSYLMLRLLTSSPRTDAPKSPINRRASRGDDSRAAVDVAALQLLLHWALEFSL